MLNEHDEDVLPRCPRLGHELTFWYCRQETRGKPCRLILNCWWERVDVRGFLQANLPAETMTQVETASAGPAPSKMLSLLEIIQQAKDRVSSENPEKKE